MHRRGGMEGNEYPFLGLIRLSGVAISVCFDLAPNFPLFMHPLPNRVDPLSRIIFAMLVWQGCRLLPWPRSHHGSRGTKHNAILFVCLNSPPPHSSRLFISVKAFAHRGKSVTAAGFDVHLSFVGGVNERFTSTGKVHRPSCVLTNGNDNPLFFIRGGAYSFHTGVLLGFIAE